MIKVFGIDFDGTLADTQKGVWECLQLVAKYDSLTSLNTLHESYEAIIGKTLEEQLQGFIHNLTLKDARKIYMNAYQEIGISQTFPKPGASELIQFCERNRIQTIVLSAKKKTNLVKCLEKIGLGHLKSIGSLNFEGKVSNLISNRVEVYAGDQASDVEASLKAGVQAILLQEKESTFCGNNHDTKIVKNLKEIINYLRLT